jgi:hypothetical protein
MNIKLLEILLLLRTEQVFVTAVGQIAFPRNAWSALLINVFDINKRLSERGVFKSLVSIRIYLCCDSVVVIDTF